MGGKSHRSCCKRQEHQEWQPDLEPENLSVVNPSSGHVTLKFSNHKVGDILKKKMLKRLNQLSSDNPKLQHATVPSAGNLRNVGGGAQQKVNLRNKIIPSANKLTKRIHLPQKGDLSNP